MAAMGRGGGKRRTGIPGLGGRGLSGWIQGPFSCRLQPRSRARDPPETFLNSRGGGEAKCLQGSHRAAGLAWQPWLGAPPALESPVRNPLLSQPQHWVQELRGE